MTKSDKAKLRKAIALLEDPKKHCKGHFAEDTDGNGAWPTERRAVKWCALGALEKYGFSASLGDTFGTADIGDINDSRDGRRKVLRLFKQALEA